MVSAGNTNASGCKILIGSKLYAYVSRTVFAKETAESELSTCFLAVDDCYVELLIVLEHADT